MRTFGFTGSQTIAFPSMQKHELVRWLQTNTKPGDKLLHGDCLGADEFVHHIALALNLRIVIYPANIPGKRARCHGASEVHAPNDPLARNDIIARECDELVAMPRVQQEELRSGTWATIRYALKYGKGVTIIGPQAAVNLPPGTRTPADRVGRHAKLQTRAVDPVSQR